MQPPVGLAEYLGVLMEAALRGLPVTAMMVRGFTPQGDAAESFAIEQGVAKWKSQVDGSSAAYTKPVFYAAFNGPIDATALLAETALATPGYALPMLPGGSARMEKLTSLTVGEGHGKRS